MYLTFVMLKPDAVEDGVIGDIISEFEEEGFVITGLAMHTLTPAEARLLYEEHRARHNFSLLVEHAVSGPSVLMRVMGSATAIEDARRLVGPAIDPPSHTLRGLYRKSTIVNAVHAADSPEAVTRELAIFGKYFDETP